MSGDDHYAVASTRVRERFWSRVFYAPDGCWLWMAATDKKGYGYFYAAGKLVRPHRWVIGPVPEGMQVDHICNVPGCVRPEHLRIVTPRENLLAEHSLTTTRQLALRTHCPRGHELSGNNLVPTVAKRGHRSCRSCNCAVIQRANLRRKGLFWGDKETWEYADRKYEEYREAV